MENFDDFIEPNDDAQIATEEKEHFLETISEFIRNPANFSIDESIAFLVQAIKQYKESYCDTENDSDYIRDLENNLEFYKDAKKKEELFKTKISAEVKEEVQEKAEAMQFKYNTSLWRKLFNYYSHNNELYGQALFHVTLGVITDQKVPYKNSHLNVRPSLFFIQRSRSGKNQGMYFVEEVLKNMKKADADINVVRGGKQNDPTLLDRYAMEALKGGALRVKRNEFGDPVVLQGTLSKTDLFWYPEADFLLNPTSKDNSEAVAIHLNLLETNGEYRKELAQWQGLSTITYGGHYSMVALTRPLVNIKKHIVYSGLLQRCIFIPRQLSKQDREEMQKLTAYYMHITKEQKQEFDRNFAELIVELKKIQKFASENKIVCSDVDSAMVRTMMFDKINLLNKGLDTQNVTETNKQILEDFLGNYTEIMWIISAQSALVRYSKTIQLQDVEYAFDFLKDCFEMFLPWLEEISPITDHEIKSKQRRTDAYVRLCTIYSKQKVKFSVVTKSLMSLLKCSFPTARAEMFNMLDDPRGYMVADLENKMISFKEN